MKITATGAFLALLVGGAFALCVHRVPPGTIAVKQVRFGNGGLVERDYSTGLHFSVWGIHEWHDLPERTQYLTYANQPLDGERELLKVRTKDGNVARVGVTVPYRIRPGSGWRLVSQGLKRAYEGRVRRAVEKALLQELANLSSNDFADTDMRIARAESTLALLNDVLREFHIEAERVLINGVYFPGDYEQKLQEKQLHAQEAIMKEALVAMEKEKELIQLEKADIEAEERRIRGQMDLEIEEMKAEAEREIAAIRQERIRYRGRREGQALAEYDRIVSEGESAIDQANAYKSQQFAEVYRTKGGRMYLASLAAANLKIDQVTLNSNDPDVPSVLDFDELIGLLVGTAD